LERVGAAAGGFATGGAECFPAKKKIAATRIIAAAETRISVLEFDLVGCFGLGDWDGTLAAGAEGSAAVGSGGSCVSGGLVRTLPGGTVLDGTLLDGALLGETLLAGTFAVGSGLGGTVLCEIGLGGIGGGKTGLGRAGLGGGWLVSALRAGRAVGRGT
jgi:hypothetical protein